MMRRTLPILAILSFVVCAAAFAGKGDRLDYPVFVRVDYGRAEDGPQGWRQEMEGWLISNLEAERCYRTVRLYTGEALPAEYLLVEIEVERFEERQVYDVAQSTVLDPDQPRDVQHAFTLRAEAQFDVRFLVMPGDADIKRKSFRLVGTHRPTAVDDAQYQVRFQLAQGVLNSVRGMICKSSGKKLAKEIDRARTRGASKAR